MNKKKLSGKDLDIIFTSQKGSKPREGYCNPQQKPSTKDMFHLNIKVWGLYTENKKAFPSRILSAIEAVRERIRTGIIDTTGVR
ncbi:MAG: hypothetical protein L6282_18895 [Candidatus Methanoperedenaceae archaeon]|nr:hypothetical protein [Candidatus Methanoperedenaceae archaeon]